MNVKTKMYVQGFADSYPSEAIQAHEAPGLAVSVVFPLVPAHSLLDIPVQQYKATKRNKKAAKAIELAKWLRSEKENGLRLSGFIIADNWVSAADFGLRFIRELPDVSVEPHYSSFKLRFENQHIDFSHAIALQYYYIVLHFGCLRAGTVLQEQQRNLLVLMDRFPGTDTDGAQPGSSIPPTPGMKLLKYLEERSKTGIGLREENESLNLQIQMGNLNWWRDGKTPQWKKGKTHPHFKLPDWLGQAAMAELHYDQFVEKFDDLQLGQEIADALKDLYAAFKEYEIWTMVPESIQHLVPAEENWVVPNDAQEYIRSRVRSGQSE
ncbi:MAG: hypothetical protein AAF292_11045 [Pseudomonadota bacterium]